jgi:opacity protein-like surface antigen
LLLFVLTTAAVAAPHGPAERDGHRGLVFGVDGDRLLSFDGAMVAVRQQMGERTGLRLGLSFSWLDGSSETTSAEELDLIFPDSTTTDLETSDRDQDSKDVELDLDLLLIRHTEGGHAVRFFYGAGPVIGYERDKDTNESVDEYDIGTRTRTEVRESTTWRFGLRALVGAEWFLTETISVHAEYRAGAVYSDSEYDEVAVQVVDSGYDQIPIQRITQSRTGDSSGWTVASHGAKVGVSLFF